jgi:hypothetical protein
MGKYTGVNEVLIPLHVFVDIARLTAVFKLTMLIAVFLSAKQHQYSFW